MGFESYKTTDVVIIGNGPSGICLSYFLSGWTPYYDPQGPVSSDDLIHNRLSWVKPGVSLIEMNFGELADGIEGRSSNPVALVFDHLCHPNADSGLQLPSRLRWENLENRAINHLVIGQGIPGGVWQRLQGDMKTLSKSSWMELPNYSFCDWRKSIGYCGKSEDRASVTEVQSYYDNYVKRQGLSENFLSNCTVTSVQKIRRAAQIVDFENGEVDNKGDKFVWEVRAVRTGSDVADKERHLVVYAENVVLATGASDAVELLNVPGEDYCFVKHSVLSLDSALQCMDPSNSEPVLVVGAGFGAADAILAANKRGLNVIHVHRQSLSGLGSAAQSLKRLAKGVYPEYSQMYRLMSGEETADWYYGCAKHSVKAFLSDRRVMLENSEGGHEIMEISIALVQIGRSPDLSFLPHHGTKLGRVAGCNIHPVYNPIRVNPDTNETLQEHSLYAMGPLVGENFVRFLQGGALAITRDLQLKSGLIQP